ncbi:nucleophile aminohydrolase [Catenaria anguillulae PL171]|uniref:Proteasome subunit beta n=1 Tax=Catenaria anguillulae PL171 TaxID=765915 RepID=A0A1Y2HZB6_9FUNG|nr:nucleophile aminohydrolase [Catenaria anguillulae PL171]
MAYNGASIVAMKGKNCVAIASDRRFGVQGLTVSCDFQKMFKVNDRLVYGLAGLGTDVQTLSERFRFKTNMYKLKEEREIEPKTFTHMVSSTLYEKRFGPYFVEPVIAGLDKNGNSFVASTDLIGCINFAKDFAVAGTASQNLYGMCESLWREDMGPEELFEATGQALLNAVDRDCLSGWGAVIHIITPERIITRTLKNRMD